VENDGLVVAVMETEFDDEVVTVEHADDIEVADAEEEIHLETVIENVLEPVAEIVEDGLVDVDIEIDALVVDEERNDGETVTVAQLEVDAETEPEELSDNVGDNEFEPVTEIVVEFEDNAVVVGVKKFEGEIVAVTQLDDVVDTEEDIVLDGVRDIDELSDDEAVMDDVKQPDEVTETDKDTELDGDVVIVV
jgi:hypothetical protein